MLNTGMKLLLVLLVGCSIATLANAEESFILPSSLNPVVQTRQMSQLSREFRQQINGFAWLQQNSSSTTDKAYWQAVIATAKARYLNQLAQQLINLIYEREVALHNAMTAREQHKRFRTSPEVKGLRNIVVMININVNKQNSAESSRETRHAVEQLLDTLVTEPVHAGANYMSSVAGQREQLADELKTLRFIMIKLQQQLQAGCCQKQEDLICGWVKQ